MASITISGGGSIPSRSNGFTSDGTSEGHAKLFDEVEAFVAEWRAAAAAQDSGSSS